MRAIVKFGPPTPTDGFRPGEYYQVILDPNMTSPGGEFIRFDQTLQGGEIHGWQRIEALTVCEVLGEPDEYDQIPPGYVTSDQPLVIMKVDHE